jgi:branched-chain amino acid transport system ATP-binding protein
MTAELVLRDVHSGYGSTRVLNGVNLQVRQGEVVALLGANGSGKSTLVKTVLNLTTLHDGVIEWSGTSIGGLATWQCVNLGLGYLPQIRNIFPSLSVEENIGIATRKRARNSKRSDLSRAYADFPELKSLASVSAGKLSGGERRMVALAATMVQNPGMLILDEPTSDLAPKMIDRIFEHIVGVRDDGLPILLVEQNVRRALDVANRVCILRRGSIVLDRPAADISQEEIVAAFMEHAGTDGSNVPRPFELD